MADERLTDRVNACMNDGKEQNSADGLCRALPLVVTLENGEHQIGAVGFRLEHEADETWQIVKGMVTGYLATALYSCVIRFESGFRDIEQDSVMKITAIFQRYLKRDSALLRRRSANKKMHHRKR